MGLLASLPVYMIIFVSIYILTTMQFQIRSHFSKFLPTKIKCF